VSIEPSPDLHTAHLRQRRKQLHRGPLSFQTPVDPSQRKFLNLVSTHSAFASTTQTAPQGPSIVPNPVDPSQRKFLNLVSTHSAFASTTQTVPRPSIVPNPVDPSQRKCLNLESMERGIASMSAGDEALRTATVHMHKAQRFCGLAESPNE